MLFLSACYKFDWYNPYDPECPKELFTPSSPGATMEGNSVKLTWSQSNDDISGFALFRSAEGEPIANLTQTQKSTTQYLDASISPGKKYTYYVLAFAGNNKSDTIKAEITPVFPITISTSSVTELTATSAKVSGNITSAGGGTVTSRGICWSTTPNPTVSNNKTTEGTGAGQYTSTLNGLLVGTTYYARAYGENSRGVSYGTEISFTLLGLPKLITSTVSNITINSATSGGTIISDGGSPIIAKGVVWGRLPNPTVDMALKSNDGNGLGSFTSTITNLIVSTKYYVRAYATNTVGTSYGEEFSFITETPIADLVNQGLIGYYPFNGNANDQSGYINNGTNFGAISVNDRFGNSFSAYLFNGDDYIDIGINDMFEPNNYEVFTINLWLKTEDIDPGVIISKFSNGNFSKSSYKLDLLPNFDLQLTDKGSSSFTGKVNHKNWINITIEIRPMISLAKFFAGGIFVNSGLFNFNLQGSGTPLLIGSMTASSGLERFFKGYIDDVRIYDRALLPKEITYLANN